MWTRTSVAAVPNGTHPAAGAYAHRAPPRHNVPSRPDAA